MLLLLILTQFVFKCVFLKCCVIRQDSSLLALLLAVLWITCALSLIVRWVRVTVTTCIFLIWYELFLRKKKSIIRFKRAAVGLPLHTIIGLAFQLSYTLQNVTI